MDRYEIILTTIQVAADLLSCLFCILVVSSKKNSHKIFFITNSIAFFILAFGDIYYNYFYRIYNYDIRNSIGWVITLIMLTFELLQVYAWGYLIKKNKIFIFSPYNLPYLLFTAILIAILIYYSLTGDSPTSLTSWRQSACVSLDMLTWFLAIICLARTRTISIMFLALGYLILVSSDLTSSCLFMLSMSKLPSVHWIHPIWVLGVLIMCLGFYCCLHNKYIEFCPKNSIQESFCAWLSITSLIVFMTGFLFLTFFSLAYNPMNIRTSLWSLPIVLVFTTITSVLLGNWFSNIILSPINYFLRRIDIFNIKGKIDSDNINTIKIYEFNMLGDFISNAFNKISFQLDREIKMAAQVAHDIRSPLSGLQVVIEQKLPEIDESKRILLRDAVYHIRDIANNLEKDAFPKEKSVTQIAVLLEHVLSERRTAISKNITIHQAFQINAYKLFVYVIPSEIKRVLTNIINNSYESIISENGEIFTEILKHDDNVIIKISDTGIGIKEEISNFLFTHGFTTKTKGSGIGLFYAKEILQQYGGNISIESIINRGTTVTIELPSYRPPSWFISTLNFKESSTVVCVDDSISIWNVWQERLKIIPGSLFLKHCKTKEDLISELKNQNTVKTFLVDYEFSGKIYTGIDLINIILLSKKPEDRIFLVSSRSNEKEVQNFCKEKNIFIIPKFFALKIPLKIIDFSRKSIFIIEPNYKDDRLNQDSDVKFIIYKNKNEILSDIALLNKNTLAFIQKDEFDNELKIILDNKSINLVLFNDFNEIKNSIENNFI